MPTMTELVAGPNIRDDDEGLFSRDINGQLVRLDAPTETDYQKTVTLQIDGQEVTVPLAEPLKDAEGDIIVDLQGRTTPRYTTILDAAQKLYVKQAGDEAKIPIPVLCHQSHMTPVAVCRMCVVQIYGQKRGKRAAERKLLPACQHPVKNGMEVFTMEDKGPDGDRVRQTVKVMTELLGADHLKPAEDPKVSAELSAYNELGQMTDRVGAQPARFQLDVLTRPAPPAKPHKGKHRLDASSPVFLVDHTACILCERCIRACDDVMENQVIGRTGKGANAGISFDLNDPMGKSSCVKCGECMVSCPTSAITFKPVGQVKHTASEKGSEVLTAHELISDPTFAGVPPKFLVWQQGLVHKRHVKKGDVICRQGDAGNTAFIIKSGELEIKVYADADHEKSFVGSLFSSSKVVFRNTVGPSDLIVGEMACLTGTPRTATITALQEGEIWEVRRNVLDRLMRQPSLRERFEQSYRARSLDLVLQNADLFKEMAVGEFKPIVDELRRKLTFVRVKPGQRLFSQGDRVNDLYLIRLGHVRIAVHRHGNEVKVLSSGPGALLGEIGLLAFSSHDAGKTVDQADRDLKAALDAAGADLATAFPPGIRSATASALGHLELARLSRLEFLEIVRQFPVLRRRLVEQALSRLRNDNRGQRFLDEYVAQGLYEGRSILTLDTDLCTRCDECTKACVQQHGTESHGLPLTRMLRDGLRFDNYLIATACRSCADPHCMFGCPVDSIHRGRHLQIVIEDHCIGCGLCAENCPYGNIFIVPNEKGRIAMPDPERPGRTHLVARPKAVTCDLCDAEGERDTPKPRCVAACPHDAAHRMTGEELLQKVLERNQKQAKPWQV